MRTHRPTHGLTLGKFAPLHKGHQLVIETALAEVDELTVVIYDSPEVTPVPLSVRANWPTADRAVCAVSGSAEIAAGVVK